jgi:hypothetical protein
VPRFFQITPRLQDSWSRFQHSGLPESLLDTPNSGPTVNITSASVFAAPPDATLWEALRFENNSNEFVVAGLEDAWLGIYRDLNPQPAHREANADVRIVTYLGRNPDGSPGYPSHVAALESLKTQLQYFKVIPVGRDLSAMKTQLADGADALIILAHGGQDTGIHVGATGEGFITAADLLEPLQASSMAGRPLRFLLVFACEQRQGFFELLQNLANAGALHPDFAGVLFWGSPKTVFGQYFIPRLLTELTRKDEPKPFLEAMRLARRSFMDADDGNTLELINCAYPIAVAFHPQPNPLPTAQELELERYFWRLSQLPETGFGG